MSDFVHHIAHRGTPHVPNAPTLRLDQVTVAYTSLGQRIGSIRSSLNALEDVTFTADSAEQLAIIGPNGAGKSTLLKVVAGIIKPDTGTVELFGSAPDEHICIGYVPQRTSIDWGFPVTVSDVVMMGRIKQIGLFRRPGRSDHEVVRHSLQRAGAEHLQGKQIGELSGGQQQRVFIARALAQSADLLLLDEPFAGLDIPSQEALLDILDGLRPDGVTVLVATHDLTMAAERFDRAMLLNRVIIAIGPPAAALTSDNLLAAYGGPLAGRH